MSFRRFTIPPLIESVVPEFVVPEGITAPENTTLFGLKGTQILFTDQFIIRVHESVSVDISKFGPESEPAVVIILGTAKT